MRLPLPPIIISSAPGLNVVGKYGGRRPPLVLYVFHDAQLLYPGSPAYCLGGVCIHSSTQADRRSYGIGLLRPQRTRPTRTGDSGWIATPAFSANACALDVLNFMVFHRVYDICAFHYIRLWQA